MSEYIEITQEDGVQIIRMNRAEKKNAITGEMYSAMAQGLKEAMVSDDIRAALLLGVEGAFSAGNDIGDFLQAASSGPEGIRPVADFLETIVSMSKPMVAGVDGLAIGVGTTMLMHCDYVLASNRSTLATPFVDLGLVPEAASSLIAPRIMGHQKAYGLLVMGEKFSAEDAHIAGLVNKVTEPETLEPLAREAAARIASQPPEAVRLSRNLLKGSEREIAERMRHESALFTERLASDEAKQAFMAFMSKGQKKAG